MRPSGAHDRGDRERPVRPLGQGPARVARARRATGELSDHDARGRGGARVTAFDAARVDEANALAGYKLTPGEPFHEAISGERMWDDYRVFLEAVLPVAEEVGVRLALHPDDPPTDIPLGGVTRILTSPEGLERAYELSGGSPAWGLDLCLGTVSEMAGEESVNRVI